jgi:hypothetical protein
LPVSKPQASINFLPEFVLNAISVRALVPAEALVLTDAKAFVFGRVPSVSDTIALLDGVRGTRWGVR